MVAVGGVDSFCTREITYSRRLISKITFSDFAFLFSLCEILPILKSQYQPNAVNITSHFDSFSSLDQF